MADVIAEEEDEDQISISQNPPDPEHFASREKLTINVGGLIFETTDEILTRFPETLLGDRVKRAAYYHNERQEYIFDRNRLCFESILHFYQSNGDWLRPPGVSLETFVTELLFFRMSDKIMEDFWTAEGCPTPKLPELPKNPIQRTLWLHFEDPMTSNLAKVIAAFSIGVIMISLVTFCVETLPEYRIPDNSRNFNRHPSSAITLDNPFYVMELCCIIWFTFEFIIRLITCPQKLSFFKNFINIIDFLAIMPFYVNLALYAFESNISGDSLAILRVMRLFRVVRILKLGRHSSGLQLLGKTIMASMKEIFLLIMFVIILEVFLASTVFFAESHVADTTFDSIPACMWYGIVTITTVGYGDMVPATPVGKLIGCLGALCGVNIVAVILPSIIGNFKKFKDQDNNTKLKFLIEENQKISRPQLDAYIVRAAHHQSLRAESRVKNTDL